MNYKIYLLSKNRKKTIYNPFDFNQIIEKANNTRSDNIDDYIILVASLTQRKRIDRALNAMKYITESYSDIKLLILGCGNLQYQLEEFVNKNNLDRNVMFLGFQENPYQYIYNAKLLMLTSDSEGLPTVLIESLILGTPVISTNCPTGPKEILEPWGDECLINLSDNENRIIEEIADKSIKLLKKNYSKEYIISKSNLGRFESETIVSQWEKL
ncbi:hypothetical protein NUITMVP1_30710 [Proteus mirabilis]|uniref:glycosyltransferase n=1 Tax=Proteus mirabilis TaxID=584 RepID=UPI002206BC09|nr:glycosyltransferase [Proteus mirabilis]BDR99162.1 hypothetical protein NUITMVP1_30710 [Proteus mirabilis]